MFLPSRDQPSIGTTERDVRVTFGRSIRWRVRHAARLRESWTRRTTCRPGNCLRHPHQEDTQSAGRRRKLGSLPSPHRKPANPIVSSAIIGKFAHTVGRVVSIIHGPGSLPPKLAEVGARAKDRLQIRFDQLEGKGRPTSLPRSTSNSDRLEALFSNAGRESRRKARRDARRKAAVVAIYSIASATMP